MSDEEDTKDQLAKMLNDPNLASAAEEIMNAYRQWHKPMSNKECMRELGVRIGEPPMYAQTYALVSLMEKLDGGGDPMEVISDAILFGLWLGNRLERLSEGR